MHFALQKFCHGYLYSLYFARGYLWLLKINHHNPLFVFKRCFRLTLLIRQTGLASFPYNTTTGIAGVLDVYQTVILRYFVVISVESTRQYKRDSVANSGSAVNAGQIMYVQYMLLLHSKAHFFLSHAMLSAAPLWLSILTSKPCAAFCMYYMYIKYLVIFLHSLFIQGQFSSLFLPIFRISFERDKSPLPRRSVLFSFGI